MAISTNPNPTIYRNLYENKDPVILRQITEKLISYQSNANALDIRTIVDPDVG